MSKLINRIPGLRLLITSLPGSGSEHLLNRSACLAMSTSILKDLPGKLDIKRHSPCVLYIYISASLAMSTSVLKALPGKLEIKRNSPSILYISVVASVPHNVISLHMKMATRAKTETKTLHDIMCGSRGGHGVRTPPPVK